MQITGFESRELAQGRLKELEREVRKVRAALFSDDPEIEEANGKALEKLLRSYKRLKSQLRKGGIFVEI